ncbi:hypothetical protein M413DRAFT_28379 [Hebeloma cylindrosporum]|uniref:F-box domain-containing protein n=1 Tax=Hebeloma cylindrosporum TaxID=76867 RepID=A0A0C2XS72_HEBCY|nr:hypothetical protein M413DRAFT_28379 [Hebeloma cylindrosporum h7]
MLKINQGSAVDKGVDKVQSSSPIIIDSLPEDDELHQDHDTERETRWIFALEIREALSCLTRLSPLDVYGLILDSLAEDDEGPTIQACSFVSRAFLPLARKHLFASVVINSPFIPMHRRSRFVHLLERKPELGEYVRKVDYCIEADDHINPPILGALAKLTKLKSLTIWHHSNNKLRWRTQNWAIRPVLLHLMQLPTLSHLKLHWIENFPVTDLIRSSSLEQLEIGDIDFAAVIPPSTSPLPRESIHLREYTGGYGSASAATKKLVESKRPDGLPIVDFTGLTKVTAKCKVKEDIDVIRTIFIQAEQLEEVDLTIFEDLTYAGLAEMLIPSIRTLKDLKLTAVVDEASDDPLSGLCHELEKILARGRSVIESLSIKVEVYTDADCKRGDEWGLLDKVLTREDAWLGLKDVSLKIEVQTYGRDDDDDLVEALNKLPDAQFKKLATTEAINFKFEVTEECI